MPTRKQRRRRQKGRRHEYEYVYVDDDGQEVEVEEDEPAPKAAPAAKGVRPTAVKPSASKAKTAKAAGIRPVPPPSWQRVLKRAAIFVPLFGVVVWFLLRDSSSPQQIIVQVVVLTLIFMPFSYFLDGLMYRQYRKRIGDPIPPRERTPRQPKAKG
jgi:hypothetical protein